MVLRFNIENEPNLPDGGPVSFTVTGRRSVDIGRDRHLDWTLPDPARMISGKHCEVHFRDGGYWLHDVSTNGTFLNGADQRMRGPHRLRDGDRLRSATTSSEFRWMMRLAGQPKPSGATARSLGPAARRLRRALDSRSRRSAADRSATAEEAARGCAARQSGVSGLGGERPGTGCRPVPTVTAGVSVPTVRAGRRHELGGRPANAPKPPQARAARPVMPTPRRPSVWIDDEASRCPSRQHRHRARRKRQTRRPVTANASRRYRVRASWWRAPHGLPDNFFASKIRCRTRRTAWCHLAYDRG